MELTIPENEREFKVFENRLRRMASRQRLQLLKSRTRDPRAATFGGYMLADPDTNGVVAGGSPYEYSMSIEDVLAYLTGGPRG